MKGLVPLLEAIAKLRASADIDLIVIGKPQPKGRVASALERLVSPTSWTTISASSGRRVGRASTARPKSRSCPACTRGFLAAGDRGHGAAGVPVRGDDRRVRCPKVVGVSEETGLLVEPDNPEALVVGDRSTPRRRAASRAPRRGRRTRVMEALHVGSDGSWHGPLVTNAILTGEALPDSMEFD